MDTQIHFGMRAQRKCLLALISMKIPFGTDFEPQQKRSFVISRDDE